MTSTTDEHYRTKRPPEKLVPHWPTGFTRVSFPYSLDSLSAQGPVNAVGRPRLTGALHTCPVLATLALKTGDLIMAVNTPAAYGMYPDDVSLPQVLQALNRSGFDNERICLMVWPRHHIANAMRKASIVDVERETHTALGVIAWLMKLGAVIIPTAGFFIRSRAFLHALVMGKDSPGLCGNSGALIGLGFPQGDAERLGRELSQM